jgi:hypothetical protein
MGSMTRFGRRATGQGLFSKIVAGACTRIPLISGETERIDRLIVAGAWTDAALALVALELPAWTVRRLAYEDGEWVCSLSRQPNLAESFDETVDASHASMALAILRAILHAKRMAEVEQRTTARAPQIAIGTGTAICCENFS